MEALYRATSDAAWKEIRQFLQEGMDEMESGRLLDFDEVVDNLEKGHSSK